MTLVEMVVALLVVAVVFAGLAVVLTSTLSAVDINQTRSQANEIATQGMEDLQRFDYAHLGFCGSPADPSQAPASVRGLTEVLLTNCTSPVSYENPCSAAAGTLTTPPVPAATYTCQQRGITYTVYRYIAWGATTTTTSTTTASSTTSPYLDKTQKSLAVVVDWTDQKGPHGVTEQSALRIPTQPTVPGSVPPGFSSSSPPTVQSAGSPAVTIDSSGEPAQPITLTATTTGLTPTDTVVASYISLSNGAPTPAQVALSSTDGSTWSGTIPAASSAYRFPVGSQFFTFTATRQSDSESNSAVVVPALRFCESSGCPANQPAITSNSVPSTVTTDSAGYLTQPLTVSVTTSNVTAYDTVQVQLQTITGTTSVSLQADSTCGTSGAACTWSATISTSAGYRFPPGAETLYFTAIQQPDDPCTSTSSTSTTSTSTTSTTTGTCPTDTVDHGATTASASSAQVTFQ